MDTKLGLAAFGLPLVGRMPVEAIFAVALLLPLAALFLLLPFLGSVSHGFLLDPV